MLRYLVAAAVGASLGSVLFGTLTRREHVGILAASIGIAAITIVVALRRSVSFGNAEAFGTEARVHSAPDAGLVLDGGRRPRTTGPMAKQRRGKLLVLALVDAGCVALNATVAAALLRPGLLPPLALHVGIATAYGAVTVIAVVAATLLVPRFGEHQRHNQ